MLLGVTLRGIVLALQEDREQLEVCGRERERERERENIGVQCVLCFSFFRVHKVLCWSCVKTSTCLIPAKRYDSRL